MIILSVSPYRLTQRSSSQLGLRVGGHLALTDLPPHERLVLFYIAAKGGISVQIKSVLYKIKTTN